MRRLPRSSSSGDSRSGGRIRFGDSGWLEVIGVVSDEDRSKHLRQYEVFIPLARARPAEIEVLGGSRSPIDLHRIVASDGEAGALSQVGDLFVAQTWFTILVKAIGTVA